MEDYAFIIDASGSRQRKIKPICFSDLGIKEREDLERWVIDNPELLGEPLLIITSEYNRFDKTSRRLDSVVGIAGGWFECLKAGCRLTDVLSWSGVHSYSN